MLSSTNPQVGPRRRSSTARRSRSTRPVDRAWVVLVRAVRDDCWRPDKAASELLAQFSAHAPALLLLRARLSRAMLNRPTPTTERALVTLDRALSTLAAAVDADGQSAPRTAMTRHG